MAKKKTETLLPERVYVWQQLDGDNDSFLAVDETADSAEANTVVGVYGLLEVRTKRIRHELE